MSLLLSLLRDSGDPGYAEAAERRRATGRSGPKPVHGAVALLSLAVVGFVLAAAVVQTRTAAPVVSAQRQELVQRVGQAQAEADTIETQVEQTRAEVAAAEAAALSSSGAGRAATDRLATQQTAAGYTALSGPGVEVTLDDAKVPATSDPTQPELGKVLDRDIQMVVNGVWEAGAEAVTVNGIRVSSRTSIRSAGGAVLVDYRPLLPPYRVAGIGSASSMMSRIESGPTGKSLAALKDSYGLRYAVGAKDSIEMAPATSALPVHAKPLGGTP
jgi:uncharacterized protein YlxW (UPF0749 family)